jgi:hypothetical protein
MGTLSELEEIWGRNQTDRGFYGLDNDPKKRSDYLKKRNAYRKEHKERLRHLFESAR